MRFLYLSLVFSSSKMKFTIFSCFVLVLSCSVLRKVNGIQCYQCSTSSDPKGSDNCGAYEKFQKDRHISVECTSDESHTPGTFCVKVTKQGLRGFIWDGRWRNVIRRCGSVSDSGVTGVCNWGVEWNGVYWEECYCSEDNCNTSTNVTPYSILTTILCSLIAMYISIRN